ncbi:hypothetical protein QO004_001737 [Rhizobium mesoamericanum]|uniref:hypothetical protein n=1 Tax=Rhizobium mesoamericanum TaxID=1079800 RepID=UPI002782E65C|nr:hypothetical protein [Rhizobium mesoamericanum]MDQ0559955.1 hypothetical protein [Rhizobium mesoamericanum]
MTNNEEPRWELDDELKTLSITFPTDPPVAFMLDAEAVSKLIDRVGQIRAEMLPSYQESWKGGQMVNAVLDPHWYSEPDALLGESLLHIRDPRFGWLHYALPRESARALGTLLLHQAAEGPDDEQEQHRKN